MKEINLTDEEYEYIRKIVYEDYNEYLIYEESVPKEVSNVVEKFDAYYVKT